MTASKPNKFVQIKLTAGKVSDEVLSTISCKAQVLLQKNEEKYVGDKWSNLRMIWLRITNANCGIIILPRTGIRINEEGGLSYLILMFTYYYRYTIFVITTDTATVDGLHYILIINAI